MTTNSRTFQKRRDLIKALGAAGAAGALPSLFAGQAQAQGKLVMGVIYVGPRDDYGYNQAQAQAAALIKKLPTFLGCLPSVHRPPQCAKRTSGNLGATARMCGSK